MQEGPPSVKRAKAWHLSAGDTHSVTVTEAQALENLEMPGGAEQLGDESSWMREVTVRMEGDVGGRKRKRREDEERLGLRDLDGDDDAEPMMDSVTITNGLVKEGQNTSVTPAWCLRLVDIEDLCSHLPRPLHMVQASSSNTTTTTTTNSVENGGSSNTTNPMMQQQSGGCGTGGGGGGCGCGESSSASTSSGSVVRAGTNAGVSGGPVTIPPGGEFIDPTVGAYDPCKTELMEKACPKIALVVRPDNSLPASEMSRSSLSAGPYQGPASVDMNSDFASSNGSVSRGWVAVPRIPLYGPYNVRDLDATKTHLWCTCGAAKTQPWCDGSGCGSDSPFAPLAWKPARVQTMWSICGCKHTQNPPFCDASHTSLVDMVSAAERRREETAAAAAQQQQQQQGGGGCSNCNCK